MPRHRIKNLAISVALCAAPIQSRSAAADRLITVADTIGMTTLADPSYYDGGVAQEVAIYSPDKTKFVVVTRRADLSRNQNEFSVLMWYTKRLFQTPVYKNLFGLASSSNEPAIDNLQWIGNEKLLFLGKPNGRTRNIYEFDIVHHRLNRITNAPTDVSKYTVTEDGRNLAYIVAPSAVPLWNSTTSRTGLVVGSLTFSELFGGLRKNGETEFQLFLRIRNGRIIALPVQSQPDGRALSISPDGHYLVFSSAVHDVPGSWASYSDAVVAKFAGKHLDQSRIRRYVLVNLRTRQAHLLLDAPLSEDENALTTIWKLVWLPDQESIVISGTHLPLLGIGAATRKERQRSTYIARVNVQTETYEEVLNEGETHLQLFRYDFLLKLLLFTKGVLGPVTDHDRIFAYQRHDGRWEAVDYSHRSGTQVPNIFIEENISQPPRLFAEDLQSRKRALLLDFNPWLNKTRLSTIENLTIKPSNDRAYGAGLYYPVDFVSGKKYPLVIQTHDWHPDWHRFSVNGFSTTANVAGPLAARGILVLQLNDIDERVMDTPVEADRAIERYKAAINFLQKRRSVDLNRIGIIGFSRTCYYVEYALARSNLSFAAASVTDGFDAGYFSYVGFSGDYPSYLHDEEAINGGAPFGPGISFWTKRAPVFAAPNVRTPLLISSLNRESLFLGWEWYASLRRLGKPVEMRYIRDGSHELEKPWDRLTSLEANFDWFRFWLQGYEDADSAKRDQYERWEKLCDLQRAEKTSPPTSCVPTKH